MTADFATAPVPTYFIIEVLLAIIALIGGTGLWVMRSFFKELKILVDSHSTRLTILETEHQMNHSVTVQGGRRTYDQVEVICAHCKSAKPQMELRKEPPQ